MYKCAIEICMGSACYLMGAQDLLEVVDALPEEKKAMIDLKGATCLKECGKGPNIRVDGEVVSNVTPEMLVKIIDDKLLG